jgi:hypothetical protein
MTGAFPNRAEWQSTEVGRLRTRVTGLERQRDDLARLLGLTLQLLTGFGAVCDPYELLAVIENVDAELRQPSGIATMRPDERRDRLAKLLRETDPDVEALANAA